MGIDGEYIGVGGGEGRGNIQQQIAAVLAQALQQRHIALIRILAPGDLQPAAGLLRVVTLFR